MGDTANLVSLIKVLFKPYGARALLPFPASEVCDQPVSLETVWGATANDLSEQLQAAKTPQRKFHLLDQFLLARLDEDQTPHPAVLYAVKEFQSTQEKRAVSQVTDSLGLSPKRFIHLFRETVGLTPKLYYRIQRFQQVLNLMEGEQDPIEWADVARMYGYFDQAHLLHDFQTFSGSTPEAYHKPKRERHQRTQSAAAQRRARKIGLLEGTHGLNAYGYPETCRRALNTELRQSSTDSSHVSLLD
jgi:AraC-like DNA-binding protein